MVIMPLNNDTDPDGDNITITDWPIPPDMGSVEKVDGSAGSFVYIPKPGALGTDVFTYEVSDGTATAVNYVQVIIRKWFGGLLDAQRGGGEAMRLGAVKGIGLWHKHSKKLVLFCSK